MLGFLTLVGLADPDAPEDKALDFTLQTGGNCDENL